MRKKSLEDILGQDDPLLDVKPLSRKVAGATSRAQSDFEEINRFIDRYGYEPGKGSGERPIGLNESKLQMRLAEYRQNAAQTDSLPDLDRHGLLKTSTMAAAPKSLDEILAMDDNLLATAGDHIFDIKHVRAAPAVADKVSERKPCKDFARFEPLFEQVTVDLKSGKRETVKFAQEQTIRAGEFFILNGLMVYVAELNDPQIRNGKPDARLRVIFENGTEGENLLRSLASQLYKDTNGRRLTDPHQGPLFDQPSTGYIYVVKSLSKAPEIAKYDGNLFKIGFTTGNFEDRIRTAKDDPTFLLAPVAPVRTYEAFDLDPNKAENLIHRFFSTARLDIELVDRFGKPFRPREWFLLPLSVIEQSISMLIDGSITQHRYDRKSVSIARVT